MGDTRKFLRAASLVIVMAAVASTICAVVLAGALLFGGCSTDLPVEQVTREDQALHATPLVLTPNLGIGTNADWVYFPNASLASTLGDFSAVNPNVSYVCAPAGVGFRDDYLRFNRPSVGFCNGIVSIQDVLVEYRLHTGGANEEVFTEWLPATSSAGSEVTLGCGVMPPWRPTGFVLQCAKNKNPATNAAWTKADIGCGFSDVNDHFFIAAFEMASNGGICIESMRVTVHATSL